ncbi:MAG: hypothetical protein ACRDV9_11050 [Acidimicrobiia bacterium]
MPRSILERRLVDISERLKRARAELAVAREQLVFFEEEAGEARLRSIVSGTPLADAEAREARRHADAMAAHRADLEQTVTRLLEEQDQLLERLAREPSGRP